MSATQQTLAQMIRAKHPGSYDDMDDATLEKNVLAKYPQYADLPQTKKQEQAKPGMLDKANEYAGKALGAAGLPTSVSDIPNWFTHFVGMAKDSKPAWESIKKAIEEPTQENIVGAVPFIGPASVAMSRDVRSGDYGGAAATLAGTVAGVKAAGQVEPGLQARSALKNTAAGAPPTATAAERMYQSALKPGPGSYSLEQVKSMVRTGLENEIPVSQAGVEKLGSLVDDLNTKIKAELASKSGATIDPQKVANRISDVQSRFKQQVNAGEDLTAIEASNQQFLSEAGAKPGKPATPAKPTGLLNEYGQPIMGQEAPATPATPAPPMSAVKAQALKQGTYAQLKGRAYGELKSATVESQKALARGIKEELVNQFPEIGQMNAKESQLIGLDVALERAVRRIDNHQLMGIGTPLAAGAAKAVTGSGPLSAATGILKMVFDDPVVKSKLAIALNRKGTALPGAYSRIAAYSGALANAQPLSGQTNEQ